MKVIIKGLLFTTKSYTLGEATTYILYTYLRLKSIHGSEENMGDYEELRTCSK